MAATQKTEPKVTFTEKLNEFMQKYRKPILFGLLAIVVALFAFVAGISLRDRAQARALGQLDELNQRYMTIRPFLSEDEPLDDSNQAALYALLEELTVFADRSFGFAAARAYNTIANIQADQKNWELAERAWSASARAARRSYLAPISIYNAAVAAEEQGNIDSAIDLYTQTLSYAQTFPAAARAQFSIGRLQESLNNTEAALEAYRSLLARWPDDPLWSNLAQNRIIVLSE